MVLTICSAMRQTQIATPYLSSIVYANKKWTDGEKNKKRIEEKKPLTIKVYKMMGLGREAYQGKDYTCC